VELDFAWFFTWRAGIATGATVGKGATVKEGADVVAAVVVPEGAVFGPPRLS